MMLLRRVWDRDSRLLRTHGPRLLRPPIPTRVSLGESRADTEGERQDRPLLLYHSGFVNPTRDKVTILGHVPIVGRSTTSVFKRRCGRPGNCRTKMGKEQNLIILTETDWSGNLNRQEGVGRRASEVGFPFSFYSKSL